MKTRKRTIAIGVVLIGVIAAIAAYKYFTRISTYFYAQRVYSRCLTINTKVGIEALMDGIASSRQIPPAESPWGHDYVLTNGEYMVQYMVKGIEPIDIVYNAQNQVVIRFESYE